MHGSWDPKEGVIAPKTRTSQRVTPLPDVLRDLLLDHRMRSEPSDDALVRRCGEPFHAASLYRRADDAWNAAGLPNRLRLQQVRHTFASLLIDAKVKAKAIQEFMGHATIEETFSRYGHLMPGARSQARALLDTYMDSALQVT